MAFIIDDILKGIGEKKQAKEQYRADKEKFGQGERSRIWNNQAAQGLLRGLFGGRYALPEDTFANFQEERPYAGPDTSKGMGWKMAGDVVGGLGDALTGYLANRPQEAAPEVPDVPPPDFSSLIPDLATSFEPTSYPSLPAPQTVPMGSGVTVPSLGGGEHRPGTRPEDFL